MDGVAPGESCAVPVAHRRKEPVVSHGIGPREGAPSSKEWFWGGRPYGNADDAETGELIEVGAPIGYVGRESLILLVGAAGGGPLPRGIAVTIVAKWNAARSHPDLPPVELETSVEKMRQGRDRELVRGRHTDL